MTSMLAMVEMKGCILNFAVKNPAIVVKMVHSTMQTKSARNTRPSSGTPVKSKTLPNTEPVLGPLCMMMVAAVMPIPTIRPMDRSVPASSISPATPRARNMRGEAWDRMFRILFTVSSGTPFMMGVTMHRPMKMMIIAMYRPLRRKKSRRLKV